MAGHLRAGHLAALGGEVKLDASLVLVVTGEARHLPDARPAVGNGVRWVHGIQAVARLALHVLVRLCILRFQKRLAVAEGVAADTVLAPLVAGLLQGCKGLGVGRFLPPIMLLLVGLGTVVFHFVSPWWWTPIASNWGYIDDTIIITFWVTGVVFVGVVLFIAYCSYRYRYQEGKKAEYEPENPKLEWWLTILTSIGVAVMLAPGLWVWNDFVTVPEGAAEFEVVAKQWEWTYRFPGKDGKLGTSDARKISDENPFAVLGGKE